MYPALINMESKGSADNLPTLEAGGSGIDREKIVGVIVHHFQDMRMSAYEDIRTVGVDHRPHIEGIMTGISADMGHKDLLPLTVEKLRKGAFETDFLGVAVPVHSDERFERGDLVHEIYPPSEISRMPDFIDGFKELLELIAEHPMRIRYDTDEHLLLEFDDYLLLVQNPLDAEDDESEYEGPKK